MNRVIAYIDGFNLYHSLERSRLDGVKWLNLWCLAQTKLQAKDELVQVKYFTALTTWNARKKAKHRNYISALEALGVQVELGVFRKKSPKCRKCRRVYETFEEKRTDVNIALAMLQDAYEERVDKIVVISGDSDLVPPIKMIKERFPQIKVEVHVPIGGKAKELMAAADRALQYKKADMQNSILPDEVNTENGTYSKPDSW